MITIGNRLRNRYRVKTDYPSLEKCIKKDKISQYWNMLPDDLINSVSINSFKAGLDGYIPNLRFW